MNSDSFSAAMTNPATNAKKVASWLNIPEISLENPMKSIVFATKLRTNIDGYGKDYRTKNRAATTGTPHEF